MSKAQVGSMRACIAAEPPLGEWFPRYVKAWCKAKGIPAEECMP